MGVIVLYGDLHLHTTASDGLLSPDEVVSRAHKLGMAFLAITDHDTIEGITLAKEEGNTLGIEVIPGIELSAEIDNTEIHILGYFLEFQDPYLLKTLGYLKAARIKRAQQIVHKLNSLGLEIAMDKVIAIAGSGVVGRLHIARAMVDMGYVDSVHSAFQNYIGHKKSAYIERNKLSARDAIEIILKSKGLPVLAHPFSIGRDDLISKLIAYGLQGIEVYHSEHDFHHTHYYLQLARKYNLLITGGSDCHGPLYKNKMLMGKVNIPYNHLESMKERRSSFF